MDQLNRRNVLRSSAIVGAGAIGAVTAQLATCSSSGGVQINPTILTSIQTTVATGCNFIPAVETIVALIAVSFPALSGVATISDTILAQISAMFCAAVPAAPAAGKMGAVSGVAVHGYVVGPSGKLVYV